MSKKETEFDRIERMKKRDKEAEVARRRNVEELGEKRKKVNRFQQMRNNQKNWLNEYDLDLE